MLCVSIGVCVCEYVQCVCLVRVCSVCVCVYCASMYVRVCFARVCVFVCVCLGQISSLPSVSLRIKSSPDGADSHLFAG